MDNKNNSESNNVIIKIFAVLFVFVIILTFLKKFLGF